MPSARPRAQIRVEGAICLGCIPAIEEMERKGGVLGRLVFQSHMWQDQGGTEARILESAAGKASAGIQRRSEEHTSELQSREKLVCRLLLEKNNKTPER